MSSIDSVAQKYRSLHLSAIAGELGAILSQAEAYKAFRVQMADTLVEQELRQRKLSE